MNLYEQTVIDRSEHYEIDWYGQVKIDLKYIGISSSQG